MDIFGVHFSIHSKQIFFKDLFLFLWEREGTRMRMHEWQDGREAEKQTLH